ncbi:hypothetical protein ACJMK2_004366, partial [Sinanodonta woodiana]
DTGLETVWVRDITAEFQADKRELDDSDLPDQLTFNLRRGIDDLTLKLRRNYEIDPNADIYVVQKLKNGRSFVAKTNVIEMEAVAYYQDIGNMAFMTVRCVARANHKCDRVINGNVRIGDFDYDIRPVESDIKLGRIPDVPSLIGKRYVLLDHAHVENKDATHTSETNVEAKLYSRLLEKQKHFRTLDDTLHRAILGLEDQVTKEKTRQQRHDYYVKVAVAIDSGIWDRYAWSVHSADRKDDKIKQKIREAYSHIINGNEGLFPHKSSKVVTENGTKCIDAYPYKNDFQQWVKTVGKNIVPVFDHAMLFTGPTAGVCDDDTKSSLIQSKHYSKTVLTATHELGHNLGARHDGTTGANCTPDERFIMFYRHVKLTEATPYSANAWLFSSCSVESFKKTLISKECVKKHGSVYDINEWRMFMTKEAGDVFTPSMQCYILYGPHHVHYG